MALFSKSVQTSAWPMASCVRSLCLALVMTTGESAAQVSTVCFSCWQINSLVHSLHQPMPAWKWPSNGLAGGALGFGLAIIVRLSTLLLEVASLLHA